MTTQHCPNPTCPHLQQYGRVAEYNQEPTHCVHCHTALEDGPAPETHQARHKPPYQKLITSLLLLVLAWGSQYIPVPWTGSDLPYKPRISPTTLWLAPLLSAFLIVEIVALLVPRWRHLRYGDGAQRAKLWRATLLLSLIFVGIQGFATAQYLYKYVALIDHGPFYGLLIGSFLLGTLFLCFVAKMLRDFGLGQAFSLLIGVSLVPGFVTSLQGWYRVESQWVTLDPLLGLFVFALLIYGFWRLFQFNQKSLLFPAHHGVSFQPSSGLLPIQHAMLFITYSGLLMASMATMFSDASSPQSISFHYTYLFQQPVKFWGALVFCSLTAILTWYYGLLLYPKHNVHAYYQAAGEDAPERSTPSTTQSICILLFLLTLSYNIPSLRESFDPTLFLHSIVLVAIVFDLVGEWRARSQYGAMVSVWPVHRLYSLGPAMRTLHRAGIPSHARGLAHRSLWHFFAPHIPVDILVPEHQAQEAKQLLDQVLAPNFEAVEKDLVQEQ